MSFPSSGNELPQSNVEVHEKHDVRLDAAMLSTEVQSEHYRELIRALDARFPQGSNDFFAGNIFKRHIKEEFAGIEQKDVPKTLVKLETLLPGYLRMMDGLEKKLADDSFAKKLGVRSTTSPDSLAEMARRSGISSPEDMGLVKITAILRGVNSTLKQEYLSYLDALSIPDLVARYEELA